MFKAIQILTVAIYLCLLLFAALPNQHNNFEKADLPSLSKILENGPFQNAVFPSRKSESKAFVSVIPQITFPLRINLAKKLYCAGFLTTPIKIKSFILRC